MRMSIKEFSTANPMYRGATVSAYTVASGAKTGTLATLYAGYSGVSQLANPQKLDSRGRWQQPVYIDDAVILTIAGISVPTHDTGIIESGTEGTFLQSGTGASARTNQNKMRDWVSIMDFGATGDGVTDDSAAVTAAATAAANKVLLVPAGFTFRLLSDVTIGATVRVMAIGGKFSVAATKTLAFNGPFESGLQRVFMGDGTVTFDASFVKSTYPEWFHDTSSADWHDAIVAAMKACEAQTGGEVVFHGQYRTTPIVPPDNGASEFKCVSLRGAGGAGGGRTAEIVFTSTAGAATKHLDFSGKTGYVRLHDLKISHATQPATAANGIAIRLPDVDGSYMDWKNAFIEGFDKGVVSPTGNLSIYGRWEQVVTNACYTTGAEIKGLLNGFTMDTCQGGRTVNGTGWTVDGGGGAIAIGTGGRCHFEGNGGLGLEINNFNNAEICAYFEDNDNIDLQVVNSFGGFDAMLKVNGSWFDPDLSQNHKRIWIQQTRLQIENTKFHPTADTDPPIFVYHPDGQSPLGTDMIVSINNDYYTASISNLADAHVFSLDAKHPTIRFSNVDPSGLVLHAKAGDVWLNTNEAEAPYTTGWRCVVSGRANANNPSATITTVLGSKVATMSSTSHRLHKGDIITVTGETFGSGDTYATVLDTTSTTSITLDKAAVTGVAGAAVQYRAAVFQPIYAGMPAISRNNISIASGGTAQLFQAVLATGQQLACTIEGINGLEDLSLTATSKIARFITTEQGGAVTSTAASYANQIDAATSAADFTITLSNPTGSTLRAVAGQSTGNPTKFGFTATFRANNGNPALSS